MPEVEPGIRASSQLGLDLGSAQPSLLQRLHLASYLFPVTTPLSFLVIPYEVPVAATFF